MYIESAKTVNEMTLNELVKLTTIWTTGPSTLQLKKYLVWSYAFRKCFQFCVENGFPIANLGYHKIVHNKHNNNK